MRPRSSRTVAKGLEVLAHDEMKGALLGLTPGVARGVLRRTAMPALLIATHHALDPDAAERWEDRTRAAFASAVAAALVQMSALRGS